MHRKSLRTFSRFFFSFWLQKPDLCRFVREGFLITPHHRNFRWWNLDVSFSLEWSSCPLAVSRWLVLFLSICHFRCDRSLIGHRGTTRSEIATQNNTLSPIHIHFLFQIKNSKTMLSHLLYRFKHRGDETWV